MTGPAERTRKHSGAALPRVQSPAQACRLDGPTRPRMTRPAEKTRGSPLFSHPWPLTLLSMRLRQIDHEARTAALAVLVPQLAAGIGDDLLGQRQAQATGRR